MAKLSFIALCESQSLRRISKVFSIERHLACCSPFWAPILIETVWVVEKNQLLYFVSFETDWNVVCNSERKLKTKFSKSMKMCVNLDSSEFLLSIQKVKCNKHFFEENVNTVFPHIVSVETILFWTCKSKGHST